MKKSILILGAFTTFLLTSCEKKTTTTVNSDGDMQTVETVGFDKERIDSTAEKVETGVKNAAEKTGDALEKAGQKIKKEANEAGNDIKDATDGDGDPKK